MTHKYAVGDEVHGCGESANTITGLSPDGKYFLNYKMSRITEERLIPKPKNKFKLGDEIIVIGPGETDTILGVTWTDAERSYLGKRGAITKINTHYYEPRYKIDAYGSWLAESWLATPSVKNNVVTKDEASDPGGLHAPGAKDDKDKPPVALVYESFPNALLEVAKVADYGAKKYTRGGWKEVHDASFRYADALARHELAQYSEGDHDAESGLLHLTHMAWNALALLELKLHKKQV